MAKQSKPQKDTMERVMREYKEGELTSGTGKKVKSRRQAVAIGLSESGSSNQQTPSENKKRLQESKVKERRGQTSKQADEGNTTKAELYDKARKQKVPGRSRMSKAELGKAVNG